MADELKKKKLSNKEWIQPQPCEEAFKFSIKKQLYKEILKIGDMSDISKMKIFIQLLQKNKKFTKATSSWLIVEFGANIFYAN